MLIFRTMKFLKVLANAVLCALFFSGLLALLAFDININLPFDAGAFVRLALALAVPYGPIVVLAVVVALLRRPVLLRAEIRASRPSRRRSWPRPSPCSSPCFLFIFWENLRYFASFFDAGATRPSSAPR